jgi:SAM-dependent methyltransferase
MSDDSKYENAGYWYREGTIDEHMEGGLLEYEEDLGLNHEDLEGKTILDLGAGTTEKFARDIKEAGIKAKVYSLSPDYNDVGYILPRRYPNWRGNRVAAIAQRIPFKENSFDLIVSTYAVTYAANGTPMVQKWVSEIGRVLKPGGEARLGPHYGGGGGLGSNFENLLNNAKTNNLDVDIKEHYFILRKSLEDILK